MIEITGVRRARRRELKDAGAGAAKLRKTEKIFSGRFISLADPAALVVWMAEAAMLMNT